MNLDDLKFFLALARHKTLSGAGKALRMKHTTVARRVASLEGSLGSRLFDRVPDGWFLTQTGENLYEHAVRIEEQAYDAQRDILGQDAQLQGPLKLTAPYDFFCNVIAPSLHCFTEAYPKIALELMCSPTLLDLSSMEADIAIRVTGTPPENLVGRLVTPLRHGIYCSTKYNDAALKNPKLLLWSSDRERPDWVRDHFPDAEVAVRTDEALTMLSMVRNHMGVARMPCYVAGADPGLRRLDLPLAPSSWGVWVLSHRDLKATARVRVCKEFLVSVIKENKALITGAETEDP